MPIPAFAKKPDVAPPPFAQQDDEEPEEEVIVEERVVKIEADPSLDEREAGRANIAPYAAVAAAVLLSSIFGYLMGAQIDRAVLANRAIDAAVTIHTALLQDQEVTKGLKSRISGAARKAIDPNNPSADFVLLKHLSSIRQERPFTAKVWSGQFYQAFKNRSLVFEYYRAIQGLWDTIDETAVKYESPSRIAALKAWPEFRQQVLEINDTKGASGYGIAFRREGDDVLAVVGTFKNSRQGRDGTKNVYQSEFAPLGGGAEKTLIEFQPGFDTAISEEADRYFIRVNSDVVVGKKRDVISPGGPLIQEQQDTYHQYLADLNRISKSVQNVQGQLDNLMQSLVEIRQARRPFTFGF